VFIVFFRILKWSESMLLTLKCEKLFLILRWSRWRTINCLFYLFWWWFTRSQQSSVSSYHNLSLVYFCFYANYLLLLLFEINRHRRNDTLIEDERAMTNIVWCEYFGCVFVKFFICWRFCRWWNLRFSGKVSYIYKFKDLGFYILPLILEERIQKKIQRPQKQKLPTMLNVVTKRVIPNSKNSVEKKNLRS
jgi:hypothetical protein